jgi:hypothetical protein
MTKLLATLSVCFMVGTTCLAQKPTPAAQPTMPYGKIDQADLELKACDFEKDANAMVLFDKGDVYYDQDFAITMERHKRIKIFNDNGKSEANIRIEYYGGNRLENITGLQAETINLVNGKPEITKLDSKLLYSEVIDKVRSAYVFSFPNVKPGSIIEYKYKLNTPDYSNLPDWTFQSKLPVKYSEFDTAIPDLLYFTTQSHIREPLALDKTSSESKSIGSGADMVTYSVDIKKRAMANVHSLPDEPYMSSAADNLQSLVFHLTYLKPISGFTHSYSDSWDKAAGILQEDEDFGGQLKRKLANEEAIITKAKALHTDQEKIAYLFKEVQTAMKWNGQDRWYTNDGTVKAWEKKTGNSAEVNIILVHLLKQAGVKVYPMVVSTREHGRVNPAFSFLYQFNRTVAYVPVDSTKRYILDATDKYNSYNETPDNLLNSTGLYINKETKTYNTFFISRANPSMQLITVNADINADGKMAGKAQRNDYSYSRINSLKKYKTDGEQKYIEYLRHSDNSLKISALKLENMEIDTLPLAENIDFKLDLTGSDGTYIYFNPAQFSPLRTNPFLSENRMSDIDFGYRDNFSLLGNYKLPAGYKTDALPKNITLQMPDNSIVFRRIVMEQDGSVLVRYVMDYKKVLFFKEDYAQLFDFYKKLHELMNEQVVLKKS